MAIASAVQPDMPPCAARESLCDATGRIRPGWRTAFASLLCLGFSPSVLQVMALGVFTPHFREEFGWTLAEISVVATILAVTVTIISPIQGLLIDRFGARRPILVCIPLFGLGYASVSLISQDISTLYLLWGLLTILGIGLWPASYVKATSSWFDRRLGLSIGLATTGIGIGAAVFPILIHWLATDYGWRLAFAAIGLASVVIGWPTAWLFIRDNIRPLPIAMAGKGDGSAVRPSPVTFGLLALAFLMLGIFSTAILFHLVSILIGNGMAQSHAVAAQAMLGLMLIAGRIGSGALVDRLSVRLVLPGFALLAILGLGMLIAGVSGPAAIARQSG